MYQDCEPLYIPTIICTKIVNHYISPQYYVPRLRTTIYPHNNMYQDCGQIHFTVPIKNVKIYQRGDNLKSLICL